MEKNDCVAEIKIEDASKYETKITYYAVWHKTNGVWWNGEVLFRTKEEAFDQVLRMPKYYEDDGDFKNAESWRNGEHLVVQVEVPVPNMGN